jgi:hypothetical protein
MKSGWPAKMFRADEAGNYDYHACNLQIEAKAGNLEMN